MTQTILLANEVLQIRSTSLKEHFRDGWNTIDMANIMLVYAFIITNIAQLDKPTDKNEINFYTTLLNLTIVIVAFIKQLSLMRVFEEFGLLIQLVRKCIYDMRNFDIFLVIFIALFAFIYMILGAEFVNANDDYPYFDIGMIILIQTYRNSIGDISAPKYPGYEQLNNDSEIKANSMLGMIWMFAFFNSFIVQIILFNFLIAIVS